MLIRAFFGLAVDGALAAELAAAARALKPVFGHAARWVPRSNYHLTLAFLGDIGQRDCDLLQGMAARVAAGVTPFDLEVGGLGWFPSPRRPRMVAALVRRHRRLLALARHLHASLAAFGYPIDKRRFTPHITLARMNSASPPQPQWPEAHWRQRVETLTLYRSDRSDGGAVYNALFRCPLGGGERDC